MIYQMDLIKSKNEKFGLTGNFGYYTFGKFDYINLKKWTINDFKNISSIYQNIDEIQGDILKRTFVLYSENVNDDSFFNIEEEYLFFIFLDLTDKLKFEEIKKVIHKINNNLKIFKTIDSFNALVCIKTRSYQEGENFILKLNSLKVNENKIVTYSYSIFTINPFSKKLNCEELLLIDMHLRINDFSEYEKFQTKLYNIYDKNDINITQHLGVSDIIVRLSNITMSNFVSNIIMNEELGNFQIDFISSTNTKFSHNQDIQNTFDIIRKSDIKSDVLFEAPRKFSKVNSIEELKRMLVKDKNKYEYYSKEYYTTIIMILSSLKQMEDNIYTNFLYKSIITSLDLFITYIHEEVSIEQIEELMSEKRLCEYIKGIESIIQCSSRSTLKSFDEPLNFDTVHYVPPLLIAFYNLLLKDLTDDFNENHTFLISPTFDTHVKVLPVFDNITPIENRVLLILIPNKLFFCPKELCPILIHEVGHYFGDTIRDRKLRYYNFYNSLLYFFRIKVLGEVNAVLDSESIKDKATDICVSFLSNYLSDKYFNEDYLNNEDNLYLDILIPKIKEAMVDFFENYKFDMIDKVMQMFIKNNYTENILKWKKMFIEECDKLVRTKLSPSSFTVKDIVDALEDIFKESYSDIFAFTILRINKEEDIDYIYKNCLNRYYYFEKEPDYINLRKKIIYDTISDEKNKIERNEEREDISKSDKLVFWNNEYDLFNIDDCYYNLLIFLNKSKKKLEEINNDNIEMVQRIYNMLCDENKSILDKLEIIEDYVNYKKIYK